MEDSRERMVRYLQDAHAAEVGIKKMLEGFINDAEDPDLQALFRQHAVETQAQADMIEQRLRAFNEDVADSKGFFNQMMAKVSELMHGAHDEYDKATQNLIKAYATEHLERGMYESLAAYAQAVGDMETANLARQIQMQEEQTAQKIWPLIAACAMTTVNATAGTNTDTTGRAYPL